MGAGVVVRDGGADDLGGGANTGGRDHVLDLEDKVAMRAGGIGFETGGGGFSNMDHMSSFADGGVMGEVIDSVRTDEGRGGAINGGNFVGTAGAEGLEASRSSKAFN